MKALTIFHVNGERTLRGGERQMLYLATELQKRGHRNVVACRAGSLVEAEARARGLETLALPFLVEFDPISAWKLRRAATSASRPLLHSHTAHAAAIAWLAAAGTSLRRVVHRRVDFAPGRGLGFELKYRGAQHVLTVSEFIRVQLVNAGLPPGRVTTVRSCVPPGLRRDADPAARPAAKAALAPALKIPADDIWIANLAALVPHKDHDTLLRAFARACELRPKLRLLIGGEGPLASVLQDLAEMLGIEDKVKFLGQYPDPHGLLRAVDLYVQSSWGEGLGSVVLEAIACGAPVVAAAAGGLPEMVEPGRTGWLFEPREPAALAEAMLDAVARPDARRAASEAAMRSLESFECVRMTDATEKAYAAALGEAAAPQPAVGSVRS